jgi:hypothetical protein
VVEPADRRISRGFLSGLRSLLAPGDPSSDLARAARIVALAGRGNRQGRQDIIQDTAQQYGELLRSFQMSLSTRTGGPTIYDLMMAVLLGLYEIVSSSETYPDQHATHVRGVSAILTSDNSPFDIHAGIELFQLANPLPLKPLFKV